MDLLLQRLTLGVAHSFRPPYPPLRFHPYVIGGIGTYRYSTPSGDEGRRKGLHGGAGLEFPVGDSPIVITTELQVHSYEANGEFINLGLASIGFKVLF